MSFASQRYWIIGLSQVANQVADRSGSEEASTRYIFQKIEVKNGNCEPIRHHILYPIIILVEVTFNHVTRTLPPKFIHIM